MTAALTQSGAPQIVHVGVPTAVQQGMLFHQLAEPGSFHYIEQGDCELTGPLDADRFRNAWQAVLDRHEALRTAFLWQGLTRPARVVYAGVELPFDILNAEGRNDDDLIAEALAEHKNALSQIDQVPLMRITLVCVSPDRFRVLWSIHHLVHDALSLELIVREVFALYAGIALRSAPSFSDFVNWLKLNPQPLAPEFWRHQLAGIAPVEFLRSAASQLGYGHLVDYLEAGENDALEAFAAASGVTLHALCLAVWAAWISQKTQSEDVVFGTVMLGRPARLKDANQIVGVFINTLPFRIGINSNSDLTEWLNEIHQRQSRLSQFEHTAESDIRSWIRWPAAVPLFESIVVFQNLFENTGARTFGELTIDRLSLRGHPNYPLMFRITPGERMRIEIIHGRSRIGDAEARRALRQCQVGLRTLTIDSVSTVDELRKVMVQSGQEYDRDEASELRAAAAHRLKNIKIKTAVASAAASN